MGRIVKEEFKPKLGKYLYLNGGFPPSIIEIKDYYIVIKPTDTYIWFIMHFDAVTKQPKYLTKSEFNSKFKYLGDNSKLIRLFYT